MCDNEPKSSLQLNENDSFKDYMLKEYELIANAHFTVVQNISTFFRHYLVLMAIPMALLSVIEKSEGNKLISILGNDIYYSAIGVMLFVVSIAGVCVCLYVMNLRYDAILYARTVNGIRRYFYGHSTLSETEKSHIRILPQNVNIPRYHEKIFFYPVLTCFALFNSFYLCMSIIFIGKCNFALFADDKEVGLLIDFYPVNILLEPPILYVTAGVLFVVMHFAFYKSGSNDREYNYLKTDIIGIDIDGVLNKHREHFCKIIKDIDGTVINHNDINHIPVHEAGIGVTREQEWSVFHDIRYWKDMPVVENISTNIEKLKNELNYKIYIFTDRKWPRFEKYGNEDKYFDLEKITRKWLDENSITYDELYVESFKNQNNAMQNRYSKSKECFIRYFIEDDYEKAIALSYICDAVYLIDQPYNKSRVDTPLPNNIIRVKTWDEIYRKLRMCSFVLPKNNIC